MTQLSYFYYINYFDNYFDNYFKDCFKNCFKYTFLSDQKAGFADYVKVQLILANFNLCLYVKHNHADGSSELAMGVTIP